MKKICLLLLIFVLFANVFTAGAESVAELFPAEDTEMGQGLSQVIDIDDAAAEETPQPVEEVLPKADPEAGQATDGVGQEATPAPLASMAPAESIAPELTPVPEATDAAPDETPATDTVTPNPDITPAPDVSPEPVLPEEIEGWLLDAEGKRLLPGKLADLMALEGEKRILVSTGEVIGIEAFPVAMLREIELTPDPKLFPGSEWRIVCSRSERLRDEYSAQEIEAAADDELAPLYIWVREELPAPTQNPEEIQLLVHAENVTTGRWSNIQPAFRMEGIGEGSENCDYAVIILDERIAMLSGDSYVPEEEGVYTVRFAIMNEMGDLVDRSEKYTLWLDWSAPEMMIEVSMEEDRTMHIYTADRVSGVAGLSIDGGASWQEMGEAFSYTAPEKQSFAPGMILVRDNAGNYAANDYEVVLKKLPSYGGGSGSSVQKDHASGDGDTASYSAYTLDVPKGEMDALVLGGEEIDLRLFEPAEEGERALPFTAELLCWTASGAQPAKTPDTLMLHAPEDAAEELVWKINGAVLRKLYNSDIAYLVLEHGGEVLSLPTIGFTGGTRYAELKMMGAATQEFDYELHMSLLDAPLENVRPGFNQSARLMPAIWVEVDGGRYQMLDRESTPEMYFYDVYCGPEALMQYPYGAYPGTVSEGETEV